MKNVIVIKDLINKMIASNDISLKCGGACLLNWYVKAIKPLPNSIFHPNLYKEALKEQEVYYNNIVGLVYGLFATGYITDDERSNLVDNLINDCDNCE